MKTWNAPEMVELKVLETKGGTDKTKTEVIGDASSVRYYAGS